jgi:hypothetical protein
MFLVYLSPFASFSRFSPLRKWIGSEFGPAGTQQIKFDVIAR